MRLLPGFLGEWWDSPRKRLLLLAGFFGGVGVLFCVLGFGVVLVYFFFLSK